MKKTKNILWGIVLIIVGIILGLNATGVINVNLFFDGWWTLFIIVPCFIGLFNETEKVGNVIGIIVGGALLLGAQDVLDYEIIWKLTLPAILVTIGISFLFKDTFNKEISDNINKLNKDLKDKNDCCATFSGIDANFNEEPFTGANLTAVFGGIEYDLSRAIIEKDVVINTSSIFGGIDIKVPKDVKIKIKSSAIFGGVSDERKEKNEKEDSKTIYINATCLFGGVEVK